MQTAITPANLIWKTDEQGNTVPTSHAFDDIYFSYAGGLNETRYVFVEGNRLTERFFDHIKHHKNFVIGETGFGTGLNFLCACLSWQAAWQAFCQTNPPTSNSPTLHFISTEKYPLTLNDLKITLAVWANKLPELSEWIDTLISQYPLPMAGGHRLKFNIHGVQVVLDLWLGDALESFTTIKNQALSIDYHPIVHAWFLDGFAPAKNGELWSDELFCAIKDLSDTSTTLATFTSAGVVRRGLLAVGASVQKIKGFGKKREMLIANFANSTKHANQIKTLPKTAIVIGAGVSGLMSAYALAERGIQVTIVDKKSPLAGASGNPQALFCPKLGQFEIAPTNLSTVGFLYAEQLYRKLNQQNPLIFTQTGVTDLLLPTQKSHEKLSELIAPYPNELIEQMDDFGGQFASHVSMGGLINPHALATTILSHTNIHYKTLMVQNIDNKDQAVLINHELSFDMAVICAGFESHQLAPIFNGRKIRGQVSWTNHPQAIDAFLQRLNGKANKPHAIKYDGYAANFVQNGQNCLLMGASFVRNDTNTDNRTEENAFNLEKFAQFFPDSAKLLSPTNLTARASIRSQTPDYHPIVGKILPSVYVVSAMGSKGFTFAPICGELVAAISCSEPLPVSPTILKNINPNRKRLQTPLTDNIE